MSEPIPFTQFLMPNGRREPVEIDRPAEVAAKARRLISLGCHFDIEMLSTGQISMTCEDDRWEDDPVLAHEICPNGPEVPIAVDRLVATAAEAFTTRLQDACEAKS